MLISTRLSRTAFATLLAITPLAGQTTSCGSATLHTSGIGNKIELVVRNLQPPTSGVIVVGASNTHWQGVKLPFDLGAVGIKGCSMLVSWDVAIPFTSFFKTTYRRALTIPLPVRHRAYFQVWNLDQSANSAGVATTNAVEIPSKPVLRSFGKACGSKTPATLHSTVPAWGKDVELTVRSLEPPTAGMIVFGVSKSQWGSLRLPFDLRTLGFTGCSMLTSWDLALPFRSYYKSTYRVKLPGKIPLYGKVYVQAWSLDQEANVGGVATTNGLELQVGF